MAGTDRHQDLIADGPVVVLVEPQLGENIGMVARAMANFGLAELRLERGDLAGAEAAYRRAISSTEEHVAAPAPIQQPRSSSDAKLHGRHARRP